MIDSPGSPGQADAKVNVGTVRSAGRRRLLQAGIAAAPVVMTVASKPVLATTTPAGFCQGPSGFISGNASGPAGQACTGVSPGYWKTHPEAWVTYAPGAKFKTVLSPDLFGANLTLMEVLSPPYPGGQNSGDPADVARACISALLNKTSGKVSVLTIAQIQGIWTEYKNNGLYSVNATTQWTHDPLIAFLQQTWD